MKNYFHSLLGSFVFCVFAAACGRTEKRVEAPVLLAHPVEEVSPGSPDMTPPLAGPPARDSGYRPKLPFIIRGSCEGEDCAYPYQIVACRTLALTSSDTTDKTEAGTVKEGDTVSVQTGNWHVLEPGIVVMTRDYAITDKFYDGESYGPREDTLRFFARDTVYLLDRGELGDWTWWYRGKKQSEQEFWSGPAQSSSLPPEGPAAVSFSRPGGEMWFQLNARNGASGWWKWEKGRTTYVGGDVACG